MNHDPVFEQFKRWSGTMPAGYVVDWNGARTKAKYANWYAHEIDIDEFTPAMPDLETEEYLEWVTLLKAAAESRDLALRPFTVVELGAGWGRWIVNAGYTAKELGIPYRLVGVEAEPQHFLWMKEHVE